MIHWIHVLRVCVYQREFVRLITQDKWWRVKSDLIFFNISASRVQNCSAKSSFQRFICSWTVKQCWSADSMLTAAQPVENTSLVKFSGNFDQNFLSSVIMSWPHLRWVKTKTKTSMFSVNVLYFHQLGLFGSVYGKNFHVLIDLITSHFSSGLFLFPFLYGI